MSSQVIHRMFGRCAGAASAAARTIRHEPSTSRGAASDPSQDIIPRPPLLTTAIPLRNGPVTARTMGPTTRAGSSRVAPLSGWLVSSPPGRCPQERRPVRADWGQRRLPPARPQPPRSPEATEKSSALSHRDAAATLRRRSGGHAVERGNGPNQRREATGQTHRFMLCSLLPRYDRIAPAMTASPRRYPPSGTRSRKRSVF